MRLTHLALRGIGPYRDEARVDFDSLPRLVAVVGRNGSGKSTLCEAILGALDRVTPTRGPLTDLATTRDAFVEVGFDAGAAFTVRQLVDGVARKGEALVTNGTGAALLPDAKVTTFDRWRAESLPPTSVLLSTVFAAQGSGGFLDLSAGDRKAVLLRALGIEHLELLAEQARERARDVKARAEAMIERVSAERERSVPVEQAEDELREAQESAGVLDEALAAARRALVAARERHAALVDAWESAERARRARQDAQERVRRAEAAYESLKARAQAQRALLADQDRVENAVASLPGLRERVEAAREALAAAEARLREREQRARETAAARQAAEERYGRAVREHERMRKAAEGLAGAREAAVALPGVTDDLRRAQDEVERHAEAAEHLVDAMQNSAARRLDGLRETLGWIADGTVALDLVRATAAEAIAVDDDRASEAREAPENLVAVRARLADARAALDATRKRASAVEIMAATLPARERAAAEADQAHAEVAPANVDAEAARKAAKEADHDIGPARHDVEQARATLSHAREVLAEAEMVAARAPEVAAAAARLDELRDAASLAERALHEARRQLDDTPEPPAAEPVKSVAAEEQAVSRAEQAARSGAAAVAVAESKLEAARVAEAEIARLDAEVRGLHDELADWTRLGRDLGRDGLQAYEIDAAGPEISTIATSLLHETFGPRWTVSLQTTRPSADGKRAIECFEVRILDTESGRDGEATGLSGGERVIVGEALSLALTTVACRRAGFTRPTLIRDESGAALDAERARAYVAMLRRAADLIGADRVLLVSHSAEVQALCDGRIEIEDGRLTVAGN